jgi:hypothetical protein
MSSLNISSHCQYIFSEDFSRKYDKFIHVIGMNAIVPSLYLLKINIMQPMSVAIALSVRYFFVQPSLWFVETYFSMHTLGIKYRNHYKI